MAILEGYKHNFKILQRAADNKELALMECTDKATGAPVMVICASYHDGEELVFIPLAKLFDGNPYHEVSPPLPTE